MRKGSAFGGSRPRAGGRPRRLRLVAGGAALTVAALALMTQLPPIVFADGQALAVDRQAYVPDAGPDAYESDSVSQGGCTATGCIPDPIDIHVGAAPQQSTYHSLLHLELSAIPAGDTVSSLVVTLVLTTDPSKTAQDNVNVSSAILDAYPLSQELPAGFSGCQASAGCNAPPYDPKGPEAVGKVVKDAAGNIVSWSFDVAPMLPYWQQKGVNTGFAVVGDAGATQAPWAVGFDRTLTGGTATVSSPEKGSSSHVLPIGVSTGSGHYTPVHAAPAPVLPHAGVTTAAPIAVHPAAPAPVALPAQPAGSGEVPLWLLVFGISLAIAVALLAQPAAQALSHAGGLRAGLRQELKLHPRMAAVAATLLVWSSGWGLYSHATGSPAGPAATASTAAGGGVAGLPTYAPAPSSSLPSATGGVSGAGTGTGGSGGGGGGGGAGASAFAGSNAPAAPQAQLYSGADNTVGITDTTIQMCAHAALTFGPEFNIGAQDLNVFWQMVDDPGADPYPHTAGQAGIYNRLVVQPDHTAGISIQDDGYQPSKAVTAAQACADQPGGDFFLLSGIGFDQIPAVRVWAEQNHMLYVHHIATSQGTAGLQYSFTMLPTLEQVGTQFGQYYLTHLNGKKIGIIERNSSNWEPGIVTFKQMLATAGEEGNIVADDKVTNNQGDYSKELVDMETGGAQVVFIWENALAADEIIQQASNQSFNPQWLLFPFNLTLYTLQSSGVDTSGMQGIVPWPAYTSSQARCKHNGDSGITRNDADYSSYRSEIQQFEAAYAKYDPGADMCGLGGDLLFGTWEAWKQVADLLVQCGVGCTRNGIAGLMLGGYHAQIGAACPVDFRGGDHHHGGTGEDIYITKEENGGRGWVNTGFCETQIT